MAPPLLEIERLAKGHAAKGRLARVRALLGAPVGVVAIVPPTPAPTCPCCQRPMVFVSCHRPARGPPARAAPTP